MERKRRIKIFFLGIGCVLCALVFLIAMGATACGSKESMHTQGGAEDSAGVYDTRLEDIQNSFRLVAERVMPVVTEINVVEIIRQEIPRYRFSPWDFFFDDRPFDHQAPEGQEPRQREFRRQGLGSGVIVKKDGNKIYVITNNHVVGNADEISVRLYDGREFEAEIVGKDERIDLALVVFRSNEDFPVARLGNSDELCVGDWALAIGNPLGFESTVTVGIISAIARRTDNNNSIASYTDYIQTDAAINRGNSGGALVNIKGEVIGINSWIASTSGGSIGLGFAIPVNSVKKAIKDFIQKGKIVYGWLGVSVSNVSDTVLPGVAADLRITDRKGALVLNIFKDSPADEAGIMPGDYIIRVDGTDISDANHLTRIIGNLSPGTKKNITVVRYAQEKTVAVTFLSRKEESKIRKNRNVWPGFVVVKITDEIRQELDLDTRAGGVVVVNVIRGTGADTAGIKPADIVTAVNNRNIASVMDFYRELNRNGEENHYFKIQRQGKQIIIGLIK